MLPVARVAVLISEAMKVIIISPTQDQKTIYANYTMVATLKGLSHEIDFENVDKNRQTNTLISAAAGI